MILEHASFKLNGSKYRQSWLASVALLTFLACFLDHNILVSAAFLTPHRASSVHRSANDFSTIALFSTPGGRAKARRTLKKRPRKKKKVVEIKEDDFPWDKAELRPIVRANAIEAGEDYWIDEADLKKSIERDQAIQNRKAMEGEIPQEKLRTEVVAPYKQNWIGLFSVGIVTLAVIINKFPELLQSPVIPIPDL